MTKNTTRNLKKRVVSVPSTFALFFQKYKHKIIVEKKRYQEYGSEIRQLYEHLQYGKNIKKMWVTYNYLEDGTLNRGNVKYVIETEDGRGYVFIYSINADIVYDIYQIPDIELLYENQIKKLETSIDSYKNKIILMRQWSTFLL